MKLNRKLTYQPAMTGDAKTQGCSNNVMDIAMPLFSVYITFIVPGAVGAYWIFKSITGTLKTLLMVKIMPYPTFTEEDYKAAEREILGKSPRRKSGNSSGSEGGYVPPSGRRSLHHIDDDEYEDTRPQARNVNKEPYREDDEDDFAQEPASQKGIEMAPLKEDDKKDDKKKDDLQSENAEQTQSEPVEQDNEEDGDKKDPFSEE